MGVLVVPELKMTSAVVVGRDGRGPSGRARPSSTCVGPRRGTSSHAVGRRARRRRGAASGRSGASSARSSAKRRAEQPLLGEHDDDLGLLEHEGQLRLRRERRQRHGHRAGQRRAEQGGHRLGPVAHEDRRPASPGSTPTADQGPADAAGLAARGRRRSSGRWRRRAAGRRTPAPRWRPKRVGHLVEEPAQGERADAVHRARAAAPRRWSRGYRAARPCSNRPSNPSPCDGVGQRRGRALGAPRAGAAPAGPCG